MRKNLSLLLILSVICFCLPAAAEAPLVEPSGLECYWNDGVFESGPLYEDVRWTSDGDGNTVHAYVLLEDGTAEIVDMTWNGYWIPETVDGIPVTAVGTLGICDRLDYPSELEIPAWITRISENALRYAHHDLFTGVDPSNPYISLENGMLRDSRNHCLLAYLESGPCALPADTERLGCYAFAGCDFDSITLPDGLIRIGDFAFAGCGSLAAISIPDSVTEFGDNPFIACEALREIDISPDHPLYGFRDGILYRKTDMQIVCVLPAYAADVWTMPEWAESVGPYALGENPGLREVHLSDGVTDIPRGAFSQCENLAAVRLPDSLETIGPEAFRGCTSLAEINLPAGVKEIGIIAFAGCQSLAEIRLPEALAEISPAAFSHCGSLRKAVLPQALGVIGENAFFQCGSLTEITIPDSVTVIGYNAFSGCRDLAVTAAPDSPAARYCMENGIRCVFSGVPE